MKYLPPDRLASVFLLTVLALVPTTFAEETAAQFEFFEKKIRPVLVENCYGCHSADAKKLKGELLLDSKPGWMAGGESGPVIVPGDAESSILISALHYDAFEMPPKAKLPGEVIADFEEWINKGAHDPRTEPKPKKEPATETFNLAERKQWWSLTPVASPSVPDIKTRDWATNDYDRFILAGLESKGWMPSKPASKTSWLRRVTYDLTGLPPKPSDVEAFLADDSQQSYQTVADRLLASEHFGEQWARHWMDLVRYAETKAFEADYPMPNAYHYRDYLIRAFNDDVPYDQMVKEAIAGDLLHPPRLNADTGINESVIGPGYLYLTDGQHGPPDVHLDEARIFDDMIDVVSKAFLSQTVACARCHDHKFDAITTKDYYSMYGLIASSRIDYADINSPERQMTDRKNLQQQKTAVRKELANILAEDLAKAGEDLQAAINGEAPVNGTEQQKRWAAAIEKKPNSITQVLAKIASAKKPSQLKAVWQAATAEEERPTTIGSLTRNSFGEWLPSGVSFEDQPRRPGDFVIAHEGDRTIASFANARAAAGHLASRFSGSLKSPRFTIEGNNVHVRVKGKNVRVSLYVRHYELIGRGPTTNGTTKVINSDGWVDHRFNTKLWVGEPAYIEIQHNGGQMNFKWEIDGHADGAYGMVDVATNNTPLPPLLSTVKTAAAWNITGDAPSSTNDAVAFFAKQLEGIADAWRDDKLTVAQGDLLEGLFDAGVFDLSLARSERLKQVVESYRAAQKNVPVPTYVRSLSDGQGVDEPVYIRGSHKNLAKEQNPRHFLDGIDPAPFQTTGSGRLQWAESVVSDTNPIGARVITNRIWHHLFGRGIVATTDDFGHMGEKPSNPDLLDFMSSKFSQDGWSMKSLIRELVLSSSYRMSTMASPDAIREDPDNITLQHMPIRRLQAESIRDTVLAVSGQLDQKLFGPAIGGDGGKRRSVYIQLKRRFMPEFLMTFDMPNATETFGRRNITASPTQSLAMMNSNFVWDAANVWAERIVKADADSFDDRVDLVHRQAFGRSASQKELAWAKEIASDHGVESIKKAAQNRELWKHICHTMLNRKELMYLH